LIHNSLGAIIRKIYVIGTSAEGAIVFSIDCCFAATQVRHCIPSWQALTIVYIPIFEYPPKFSFFTLLQKPYFLGNRINTGEEKNVILLFCYFVIFFPLRVSRRITIYKYIYLYIVIINVNKKSTLSAKIQSPKRNNQQNNKITK